MPSTKKKQRLSVERLLEIMARLRSADGCPWDREQDHESIKQCLVEEAYEVVEAIESGDMDTLCDELGDLLLQVVFHAQLASERRDFDFHDVVVGISEKLIRRHPHVFGKNRLTDSDAVLTQWESIKKAERHKAGKRTRSVLDHVPKHLPALMRAEKMLKRAAKAGLHSGRKMNAKSARALGDALLQLADAARQRKWEPEQLLRDANKRFERRIRKLEKAHK
jgi:uncharacterized protein YabN with tetrapyrrole methylase and pyrophosphatase domain